MRYRVARTAKGKFVVVWYDEQGGRHRSALASVNKWQAQHDAGEFVRRLEAKRPKQALTVGQIVDQYFAQSEAIWKDVDKFHWRAASPTFADVGVGQITDGMCRDYAATRKARPGTIRKELGVVRSSLSWARKRGMIETAPTIWMPPASPPRDRRLTRAEAKKLIAAAARPHIQLFIILALNCAGRAGALLALKWSAVDLDRRRIDLGGEGRQKGRARVPINDTLHAALTDAHKAAMTPFVIEWAGDRVKSIKRAFRAAVRRAKLSSDVTPHVLRHTAASWMAEKGVSMDEIAQFLGHSSPSVTYKVYARFSPDFLQKAASALE
jgi:integrase